MKSVFWDMVHTDGLLRTGCGITLITIGVGGGLISAIIGDPVGMRNQFRAQDTGAVSVGILALVVFVWLTALGAWIALSGSKTK